MSHYMVAVLVDVKDTSSRETLDEKIGALLAPYNENVEVDPYEKACYCVGNAARVAAVEEANAKFGTFDSLRESFQRLPFEARNVTTVGEFRASLFAAKQFRGTKEEEDALNAMWRKHIAARIEGEKAIFNAHPLKTFADEKCNECHGSGKRVTTYNPKSKWDWWTIGGRWTGTLKGINPRDNPNNYERCHICAGTGKRQPAPNAGAGDVLCNGCEATGKALKFAAYFEDEGNIAAVRDMLADEKELRDSPPFAIVTPDGKWHERGEMGWFGCVSNEKARAAWSDESVALLKSHPNHYAVCVDCHI